MEKPFPIYHPQFFTATINDWQYALADERHKDIIIDSLKFGVIKGRIELTAFVIMNNHVHLIWQPLFGHTPSSIQASFMKYTAQQLKRSLSINNEKAIDSFKVNKHDRKYQLWKRDSLSIPLISQDIFIQKLEYTHYNPVSAGICEKPEDYYYSSAKFYHDGIDSFGMLTHFSGN